MGYGENWYYQGGKGYCYNYLQLNSPWIPPTHPDTIKYQLNTLIVYWLWWGMIVSGWGGAYGYK